MKRYPTQTTPRFLCFVVFALLVIMSCTKDNDLLKDTVLDTTPAPVEEVTEEPEATTVEETAVAEEPVETITEKIYEARTSLFPPIHDAHLQGDIGYDQNIVRLEEGRRISYLMFDLSPIDSIGGMVEASKLEFTIDSDDGSGTISVFKANSSDWSENDLSAETAPETGIAVGEITTNFEIGQTHEVVLDTTVVGAELLTLILIHEEGNDLAFASKEHPSGKGPSLIVNYSAPEDAEAIFIDDSEELELVVETPTDSTNTDTVENTDVQNESTEQENQNEENSEETAETADEATSEETSDEESENKDAEETGEEESSDEASAEDTTEQSEENAEEASNSEADAPQNESPVAVAEATPSSGDAPLKVTFKGNNSSDDLGIKNYSWDFRDGSTSTEANPTHTFDKIGILEVRLTVTDDQGLSDTETVTITITEEEVENKAPEAVASANPTSGEATLEVQFKGSSSADDTEIKKYFWDFKDGTTSTKSNPSHSFSEAGTFEVELSVTDEEGLTDTETVTIAVSETENEAPEAIASGSPLTGDAPLDVQFKASASKDDNGVTGYFWDFKDGSTTTSKNPSHTFSEPGEYQVELSVKDAEGLTDATTVKITVNQRPVDNGGGNDNGDSGNGGNQNNGGSGDNSGNNGSSNNGGNSGNHPSNAVFASSFGFRSGDATAAFKAAINSGSSYVVIDKQSSDWVIQPTRFFNLRNMTIVFESGVTVRAKSGAFGSDDARLFQLTNAENITIEGGGATLRMNKGEYNSGEQRHGLDIDRGKNITVRGLTIRDTGGDGVHIKGNGGSEYSENITLENIKSINNKRDGIGIVSAQDVWVRNSEFLQTSGKKPESGVILECDRPTERLVNINFIGCKFSSNGSAGFHFSSTRMNSSSRPVSIKVVDCEFRNNIVSPNGQSTEVFIGGGRGNDIVGGEIRFERVKFNGSTGRIIFTRKSASGFKTVFKDCEATNVVSSRSVSPIRLEAHEDRSTLGGITFENFEIAYSRDVPFMNINAPSKNGSFSLKNIQGSFKINEPNDNPLQYSGGYRPSKNQNVSINYNHN